MRIKWQEMNQLKKYNTDQVRITISIPKDICRHLDEEREKLRVLRSHWIREAILEKLGRVEKENLKFSEMEREIETLKSLMMEKRHN